MIFSFGQSDIVGDLVLYPTGIHWIPISSIFLAVSITEKEGIFDLTFDLQGVENVPLAIEFAFRKGGFISNAEKINDVADSWLLSTGTAKIRVDNDEITIGPGKAEHRWTAIRGGLPKPEADCIYITGFTPFKHKISIG